MKVPNALTRDDTEHGVYYYLASEVDAALAERDAEIERLKAQAHTDHPMRHYDRTCPACTKEQP